LQRGAQRRLPILCAPLCNLSCLYGEIKVGVR
jgi:hypothetical protein